METTLFLIRHAETEWNKTHRYIGKTDIPLSETGTVQAKMLKTRLEHILIDAVYTSPAVRVRQTCAIVFSGRVVPVISHPGLAELNFGAWEGLTYEEIGKRYPKELSLWEKDPLAHTAPGGESMRDVKDRLVQFTHEVKENHEGKTVALVGHGGSLSILLCILLGIIPRARWQFRLSPASLSELVIHKADTVIMRLNDTNHLRRR